jgi:hypothetical protein
LSSRRDRPKGQYDRLTSLAGELLDRKVAVIVATGGSEPAKVAKAATATIPIVFVSAADPVRAGVVTSFNRPGGNITGVSLLGSALAAGGLLVAQDPFFNSGRDHLVALAAQLELPVIYGQREYTEA